MEPMVVWFGEREKDSIRCDFHFVSSTLLSLFTDFIVTTRLHCKRFLSQLNQWIRKKSIYFCMEMTEFILIFFPFTSRTIINRNHFLISPVEIDRAMTLWVIGTSISIQWFRGLSILNELEPNESAQFRYRLFFFGYSSEQ